MQLKKRTSYLHDEDAINELLRQDSFNRKKTKFTDFVFGSLIYIILIPTLIYNAVWYFNLKNSLLSVNNEDLYLYENRVQGCTDIFNWVNYSLTWVLICFFKAIFLLFAYFFCCSGENDCTMVCVVFKSLTSLLPSLFYILKIPDYVKNYHVYSSNAINLAEVDKSLQSACDLMASTLLTYYKWEYSYMIFVIFVFCFIPAGAICMCIKEFWKGLNYTKED